MVTNLAKNGKWSFDTRTDREPVKMVTDELEVDAMDSPNMTLLKSTMTDKSIEVQRGENSDVNLLYIRSNNHHPDNDDDDDDGNVGILYKLGDFSANNTASIYLNTDYILNNSEIVELLPAQIQATPILRTQKPPTTSKLRYCGKDCLAR
jgi:hypothetical protein